MAEDEDTAGILQSFRYLDLADRMVVLAYIAKIKRERLSGAR